MLGAQASPKLPEEQPPEKKQKVQQQKRSGSAAVPTHAEPEEDQLPFAEVIRRLRALEQPITLFGEASTARSTSHDENLLKMVATHDCCMLTAYSHGLRC